MSRGAAIILQRVLMQVMHGEAVHHRNPPDPGIDFVRTSMRPHGGLGSISVKKAPPKELIASPRHARRREFLNQML